MKNLKNENLCQVGIVVKDVEKAAKRYSELLGVDMPNIIETDSYKIAKTEYMGKPTEARAKIALIPINEKMTVEFIEPIGEPSTWNDFKNNKGEGIHHLAFFVDNMKETVDEFKNDGIDLIQKGEFTGGRYAYMGTENQFGFILELLEIDG